MKFHVERDTFADAVAWTARSLPSRPTVPVLAGLRLEATGDQVTLSGFDYEVSAHVQTAATVGEEGTVLVSGRLLSEIVRSLPAQPVAIVVDGQRAVLTCGSARFTLPTMPVDEYPSLPAMPPAAGALGSDEFAAAVAQVAIAAGRDDTLPVLTGVRLELEGDTITLAATDRYRLAVRELTWRPEDPGLSATALVPARTLSDTAKTLTSGAEVHLALSASGEGDGLIGFIGGHRRTTTRLLDGEFPKYRSLLPTEASATADITVSALTDAVKRVSLVAARNAPIRLAFSEAEVVLEAGGGEDAQASEALEAEYAGEPMTIAFNPSYLLDGLGAIDADTARLSFTTPTKPAVLTGKRGAEAAAGGHDYRYLLMPVRLSG